MGVEDLLDWIDRRALKGALTVEWSSTVRSFVFDGGFMTSASSNEPGEHVGQLLLRAGLLDQETLGRALEIQAETGGSLSRLLTNTGALAEEQLRPVLEEQASEALLDTWAWPDGTFVFELAEERAAEVDFAISVRIRTCLVAGRQRAHRWRQIRQIIPSEHVALSVVDRAALSVAEDSEDELEHILELVNDIDLGLSLDEIVARRHGRRFGVLDRLVRLVERGGLAVSDPAQVAAEAALSDVRAAGEADLDEATAEELERAARRQAAGGHTGGAFELTRRALALEPHSPGLQRLYREIERSLFAELSRELLTSFRVPRLLVSRDQLDELALSETERYLAGRIDGQWDLLSLMRVSPLREVEVLITFKRLADQGIVSL